MFKIKGIDHIVLITSDVKAMVHFYCDILGCSIERVQEEIQLTQLRAGQSIIDIVYKNSHPTNKTEITLNMEHFCLRIEPFHYEELKKYFKKHGVDLKRYGDRFGAEGYGPSFYLNDPEGNEVELSGDDEKN